MFFLNLPKVSILNLGKLLRNFKYLTTKGLWEKNVLLYFRRNFNKNLICKKKCKI